MKNEKIGILVEGGGMKCAFSAGVLDVFIDEKIKYDYVIGVSAGAANAASFVAGQRDRNKRFYVEHSKLPQYMSVKNWIKKGSLFDLEYIYGTLSCDDGIDPLDYEAIMNNKAQLVIPATCEDGTVKYFTKEDMAQNDYRVVMASSSLPVLSKPIIIGDKAYYDGGVGDSLPIKKMLEDGCSKIIVIFSKPRGYRMDAQSHKAIYRTALKHEEPIKWLLDGRHINYNNSMELIDRLEKEGKVFTFSPSPEIKMATTDKNPKTMEMLYNNGAESAKAKMYNLKKFLSE